MYLDVLNLVRDPVFVHDREYKIIFANKAYLSLCNMTLEQAVGRLYYEVFPLHNGPLESCCVQMKETSETSETSETIIVHGESYLNRSIHFVTLENNLSVSIHILENMSFPKTAKLVLDHLHQKVFVKDTQLNYLFANKSYSHDLGLVTPEAIVGKNDFE